MQPEEVREDVAIMATGRSDYPNQINNVLAFPGVITDDALAADCIIPSVFNREVTEALDAAVAEAGTRSGVARRPVAPTQGA